jgi:hypothetical protein
MSESGLHQTYEQVGGSGSEVQLLLSMVQYMRSGSTCRLSTGLCCCIHSMQQEPCHLLPNPSVAQGSMWEDQGWNADLALNLSPAFHLEDMVSLVSVFSGLFAHKPLCSVQPNHPVTGEGYWSEGDPQRERKMILYSIPQILTNPRLLNLTTKRLSK